MNESECLNVLNGKDREKFFKVSCCEIVYMILENIYKKNAVKSILLKNIYKT